MESSPTAAAGSWSYVHDDDEDDDGRIVRLAENLGRQYALLRGEELELFVDRALKWGEEWEARIDSALGTTTFFIPVITPRYFKSSACRGELLKFFGHATSLGVSELLLPLLYVTVPELSPESEDEVVSVIAKTQYEDWTELRLEEETSSAYRRGIVRLAKRLGEISDLVAARPVTLTGTVTTSSQDEEDDEPGLLELLAEGEAAMERWSATVQAFPDALEALTQSAQIGEAEFAASDAQGRGFAGRLAVTRRVAKAMEKPAHRIAELGHAYASDLVKIDPAILTIIREAEAVETEEEWEQAEELFGQIQFLTKVSLENAHALTELRNIVEGVAKASREMRPVANLIRDGLRGVLDAQAIIDEWARLIDQTERPKALQERQ